MQTSLRTRIIIIRSYQIYLAPIRQISSFPHYNLAVVPPTATGLLWRRLWPWHLATRAARVTIPRRQPYSRNFPSDRLNDVLHDGNSNAHQIRGQMRTSQKATLHEQAPTRALRRSPSDTLTAALETGGHHSALPPKYQNRLDHSHFAPFSSRSRRRRRLRRLDEEAWGQGLYPSLNGRSSAYPLRLQLILSQYLELIQGSRGADAFDGHISDSTNQGTDRNILRVFNEAAIAYLHLRGYDVSDVPVWAWILTASTSEQAALRLMIFSTKPGVRSQFANIRIPVFVFLYLLRRREMTTRALKLLIVHAWDRLNNSNVRQISDFHNISEASLPKITQPEKRHEAVLLPLFPQPKMSEPTIVVMVIRLLRHARKHWPAALGNISSMFITHVRGNETIDTTDKFVKMPERTSARLSLLYNRILTLLALPSSQHPYRAIPYHQRAQFNVISKMNDFEPPLAINVEGYRAVVVVQLAHRKTLKEREWAKMKAVSWPPWKEEKLGIDADIGVDSGISRADETLSRLKEGGYASRPWQSAAKILSGWDTDQSPTIQTRAIFQESVKSRHVRCLEAKFINSEADSDVWAARIRSTRTLNESWACFVAYKDRNLSASIAVYYAMIEKLVFDTKRNRKESQGHSSQLLGQSTNISLPEWSGDSKEVSADPKDPRDTIYVRTPPPSLDDFFQTMIADGLVPSGRCLSFLISHAGTKSVGVKYLTSSNLPPGTISTLLGRGIPKSQDIHDLLKTLPEYMFASYIRFLCRFGSSTLVQDTRNSRNRESTKERRDLEGNTLLLAFRLMYVLKPTYRPAWYSLLSALIRPRVKIREGTFGTNGHVEDMATWYATLRIIDQMKEIDLELDFEGFQKICIGFEKAFAASQQILAGLHQPLITEGDTSTLGHVAVNKTLDGWERNRLDAEEIISNGTTKLTSIFKRLVAGYNSVDKSGNRWNAKAAADLKRFSRTEQEILLPKLLEVPSPAELHAFIRALGLSRDHDNLLALAQWMAHFSPELKAVADELRNGSTLMRRCLIAMRVFLEGHWQYFTSADGLDDDQGMQRAPEIVIEKVFRIIKEVEGWGGLPTDEEVETYCQRARSDRKPYSP